MGVGHDLGMQLNRWLAADPAGLRQSRALTNRLMDALGANDGLRGPIRDLASQPLLLQVLHSQGAEQQSALASLSAQLRATYAPAVLQELLDLLEGATGQLPPPDRSAADPPAAALPTPIRLRLQLERFGPGLALAAAGALVFAWVGAELDRALFEGWGWSGGVVLVLVLALLQALSLGPLKQLKRHWPLPSAEAAQPRQAWQWLSQAWIHANDLEAILNLILLLILLGASPLQLGSVVLRYCLTALACLGLAALCAARWQITRRWSGASGAISALIALAAGLSLLHWRVFRFSSAGLEIPAWVLLLVYGALQLGWQLPRQNPDERSTALQRVLSSSWGWGLLLGLSWAVITRIRELL
ncbi:rhomboid family intramembrane serine protease [Synechococcus sp. HK05]|uniref:rhomboid family intramembrane serine protease n=1 Tax=Synechococcus sp. HK05 TaxID=2725975 RepID=UPI001C3951AF|nr:rhomboid family intramembrane serine protease [Synechococcus sp. HK05]MBV2350162.1 rhomboid family intramembrane serine protease [Synechococcus sp. HK05]